MVTRESLTLARLRCIARNNKLGEEISKWSMLDSTTPLVAESSGSPDHRDTGRRRLISRPKLPAFIAMRYDSLKGARNLWVVSAVLLMSVICTTVVYAARAAPLKASRQRKDKDSVALPALPDSLPNSTTSSAATTRRLKPKGRMLVTSWGTVDVWTTDGNITGRKIQVMNRDIVEFLGIPYGASTNGTGRFRNPKETPPWCTVLNATNAGPSCPQPMTSDAPNSYTLSNISEDCLRLNIWAPLCAKQDQLTCLDERPLMVYFYGGGFQRGSNSLPFYDGRYLAAIGNVVVAVPNYRVGVFGFPSRPIPGADPNPGLQDLILAITWLKLNADSFGANPNDIVPFGQSAGGTAIGVLLAAGHLRPSMGTRKVIISSGAVLGPPWNPPPEKPWNGFLRSLSCGTDMNAALSCLEKKSIEKIIEAQEKNPGVVGLTFPDQNLLQNTPSVALSAGLNLRGVHLLLANTMYEGDLLNSRAFGEKQATIQEVVKSVPSLRALPGSNKSALIQGLKQLYPDQGSPSSSVAIDLLGDIFFNCPAVTLSDLACGSHADVKHIILTKIPQGWGTWHRNTSEASHSDDLPYVFGTPLDQGSQEDMDYAKMIIGIWTGFAWNGTASLQNVTSRCHDNNRWSTIYYPDRQERIQKWRRDQCCFLDRFVGYETHDLTMTTTTKP